MHVAVDPAATAAMVGASGPIFSLLPIVAVVRPRTLAFIVPYVVVNLLALVLPQSLFAMPGVAVGAHIGGFATGAAVVVVARARQTVEAWRLSVAQLSRMSGDDERRERVGETRPSLHGEGRYRRGAAFESSRPLSH